MKLKVFKTKNKPKKQSKPREITFGKLDSKLWDIFSEWIRRRKADEYGMVKCFTCGKVDHWKKMQAGHFISRRQSATKYDEVNVQCQCVKCNIFNQGAQFVFGQNLDKVYGKGTAEGLEQKSRMVSKRDRNDLIFMIDEYNRKIKEL